MKLKYLILIISVIVTFFVLITFEDEPLLDEYVQAKLQQKLEEIAPSIGVDVSKLPEPKIEETEQYLIFDYKDYEQNAWIVMIVHPNGHIEASFDSITQE